MEIAFMTSDMKSINEAPENCTRIYYGQEFCPHLMFNLEQIKKVLCYCEENAKELTLVTPYLTDKGMENMIRILDYLKSKQVKCELVINDWGLLYYIDNNYRDCFTLVLGRLLNKLKKSPVVMNFIKKIGQDSQDVLRYPSSNFFSTWELLKRFNVGRVEFENVLQENCFEEGYPFEKSLLLPYVFITTARRCVSDFAFNSKKSYDLQSCNKTCQKYTLDLYNKIMLRDIILKGNTYYYKNDRMPDNLQNFSRLVFQKL